MNTTNQQGTAFQMSRAEQETQNEANRLTTQVEAALAAVALPSIDSADALELSADRIERAARDLADTLRELAQERKASAQDS